MGIWNRPEPRVAEPKAEKKQPAKPPVAASVDVFYEPPPSFSSVTASLEWVWSRMDKGDVAAAETLFLKEANITDEQRGQIALQLLQNFRRFDPRVLARIVLSLPRGKTADMALNKLISEWSRYDSEDVLRFLETLPEDRVNSVQLTSAAFGLARLPAERVAAFAATLDDNGRSYLADGLVESANQAGSWRNTSAILSKMNAEGRKDAVPVEWTLGVSLSDIAPEEIERRIASETDPVKRDQLLAGHAWVAGIRDPERGIRLDAQIELPQVRANNLERHTGDWLETDRNAALAWLQSTAAKQLMSLEVRAKFLKAYELEAAP